MTFYLSHAYASTDGILAEIEVFAEEPNRQTMLVSKRPLPLNVLRYKGG